MKSTLLLLGLSLLLLGGFLAHLTWYRPRLIRLNEAEAMRALHVLAQAEDVFRYQDKDKNGIQDYWTGDLAGLADVGLIPLALAAADAKPLKASSSWPTPISGYLFVSLDDHDCSWGSDVIDPGVHLYRTITDPESGPVHGFGFGFCTYPSDYGRSGRSTFLLNEHGHILRLETRGHPVFRWPAAECGPPPLFWQKLD